MLRDPPRTGETQPPGTVWLPRAGLRKSWQRFGILIVLGDVAIWALILLIFGFGALRVAVDWGWPLPAIAGYSAIGVYLVAVFLEPSKIGVSAEGITFVYPMRSIHAAWDQIDTPNVGAFLGMYMGVRLRTPVPQSPRPRKRSHIITMEQFRGVLAFPGHPSWALPQALVSRL